MYGDCNVSLGFKLSIIYLWCYDMLDLLFCDVELHLGVGCKCWFNEYTWLLVSLMTIMSTNVLDG